MPKINYSAKHKKLKNKPIYHYIVNLKMNLIIFSKEYTLHVMIFLQFGELQLFEYLWMKKLAKYYIKRKFIMKNQK